MKIQWSGEVDAHLRQRALDQISKLYHESSKLSPETARRQGGAAVTNPIEKYISSRGFRQYEHLPRVPLPAVEPSERALSDVLRARRSRRDLAGTIGLERLSAVLQQALGPTLVFETDPERITQAWRAWPSAGGLFPIDTYVVAQSVEGLDEGLYHYNITTAALERLPGRRAAVILRDGFFWQDWVTTAAAVILMVAVFERTQAKYGERGYRLVLLDAGHAGQNVLLVAEEQGVSACAVAGFCDDALAGDLDLDGVEEAVVHTIVLGSPASMPKQGPK